MGKKNLNPDGLLNELKGNSSFFPVRPPEPIHQEPHSPLLRPVITKTHQQKNTAPAATLLPGDQETSQASNQESLHASIPASNLASSLAAPPAIIESIRKMVKTPAKEEVLYIRVTKEEKNQLGDIEYTYDRQDIETSANELGRIAINFLIADYKANGENSILAKVVTALHA